MGSLERKMGRFPLGVWIALAALLSLIMAWGMQAYSLLDWDGAVDLGIQNERLWLYVYGRYRVSWGSVDCGRTARRSATDRVIRPHC